MDLSEPQELREPRLPVENFTSGDTEYYISPDGQFRVPSWLWDHMERDVHPAVLALLRQDMDALAATLAVIRDKLRARWLRGEWIL